MYNETQKSLQMLLFDKHVKAQSATSKTNSLEGDGNINKSANVLALCHPPSASFCSVLAGQWSSCIFTHDRYNILSDILIEFEVNLGIIIEKCAKT